jgi:dienelactone hydrolase
MTIRGTRLHGSPHAFARDEGLRYDATAIRIGWDLTLELFKRKLV